MSKRRLTVLSLGGKDHVLPLELLTWKSPYTRGWILPSLVRKYLRAKSPWPPIKKNLDPRVRVSSTEQLPCG